MSAADIAPVDRHIALITSVASTEGQAAIQLMETVLWALRGTTRSNWVAAQSADAADVVVLHQSDTDERVADWRRSGKAVVVIAMQPVPVPQNPHVLIYPFGASQVRELLNSLDTPLVSGPSPAAGASGDAGVGSWSFLKTLGTLRELPNSHVWLVGKIDGTSVFWLRGDGTEWATESFILEGVRNGVFNLERLVLEKSATSPVHRTVRPAADLCWFAGYYAGFSLAPWLSPSTRYRISRWPNFGLIRPATSQIRATAVVATSPATVNEVAARARIAPDEAARTLNALWACNLLTPLEASPAKHAAPRRPRFESTGGLRSLLQLLRNRLGL